MLVVSLQYLLKSPAAISWYLLFSAVTEITAINAGWDWIGEVVVAVYMLLRRTVHSCSILIIGLFSNNM